MTSKVLFASLNDFFGVSRLKILSKLLSQFNLEKFIEKDDIVAIKVHFGEDGNLAYIHPRYVSTLVKCIKDIGAKCFITDTNTLNGSSRLNSIDHIMTARKNGFTDETLGAPIIISDGIKGNSCHWIKDEKKHIHDFAIGKEIVNADKVIYISHFKGHQIGGFGGALKNLGVGSASKIGKMEIHNKFNPSINQEECIQCGKCKDICKFNSISKILDKYEINKDECVHCCECTKKCPQKAISLYQSCSWQEVQERYIEYADALLKYKPGKIVFINILENITQTCGCWAFSDSYIVADLGYLISCDPVSIDRASYDLINDSPYITSPKLNGLNLRENKFKYIYPNIDPEHQLIYAHKLRMGNLTYTLEKIEGEIIPKRIIEEAR